jgi:hypothetical protein
MNTVRQEAPRTFFWMMVAAVAKEWVSSLNVSLDDGRSSGKGMVQ